MRRRRFKSGYKKRSYSRRNGYKRKGRKSRKYYVSRGGIRL